jgi:hypothetical protein
MDENGALGVIRQALQASQVQSKDPRIVGVTAPGDGEMMLITEDVDGRQAWILFSDDLLETDPPPPIRLSPR